MPSTFASAAAGNNSDASNRRAAGRSESGTFGEWGRRPNGATQTFRRPSLATNAAAQSATSQRESLNSITSPTANSGAYVPPHRNGILGGEQRYSKEQLLDLFRMQRETGELDDDVADLFVGDWDRFSKRDESIDPVIGPEACLEHHARSEPLGLIDLTSEERDLFSTTVNSALKAPNQTGQRDGQHRDISGARKMSFSQNHGSGNVSSPVSTRPFGRRRDTNEAYPFPKEPLTSPSVSKYSRDDPMSGPPNPLVRRRTDLKDLPSERTSGESGRDDDDAQNSPFGLSKRISSGPLSAGLAGPPSPWSSGGGLAGLGATGTPGSASKRPSGLNRSESRFKNLMNRESSEALSGLGTLPEDQTRRQEARTSSRDSDRFDTVRRPMGSAALGGGNDDHLSQLFNDPNRAPKRNEASALEQHKHLKPSGDEPSSPTYTNPYQSPERNMPQLNDYDADDLDINNLHLPGLGGMRNDMGFSGGSGLGGHAGFGSQPERSQGFGGGPQRGFSGLGGLGTLPSTSSPAQWPTAMSSGTPGREHAFSGFSDMPGHTHEPQGQGFASLAGLGGFGREGLGDSSRGLSSSRLGSLFPSDMQNDMRAHEGSSFQERARGGYDPFSSRLGQHGSLSMGGLSRDIDNPFEPRHSHLNESYTQEDKLADSPSDAPVALHQRYSPGFGQGGLDLPQRQCSADPEPPTNQPPAAQQKTMVMPDRIRWIYRDPQGNTQGPWSGLEMHDWYRAGFFSPELLVKKVEDPDYEPLAQLIRRIGNSREPFLVPQIGIPGPPSSSGNWPSQPSQTATAPAPATSTAPSAQPPFASSFPSFGTTLTAEQQNALERRKQEEQYLMARQKEHLAQQQILAKQRSIPGGGGLQGYSQQQQQQSLQHQSSAHSLQSQPSYGSMTAPGQPIGGNRAFDGRGGVGAIGSGLESLGLGRNDDGGRTFGRVEGGLEAARQLREQGAFNEADEEEDRIAQMLADRARLEREQAEAEQVMRDQASDQDVGRERLQQFNDLQEQQQAEAAEDSEPEELPARDREPEFRRRTEQVQTPDRKLTLTEQVQKAASAKQSPSSAAQSPWANKVDKPIAESHPASGTSSPLPAPAARRNGRQSVADALAAESSKPASPAVETPSTSIAPWAREAAEGSQKQPSLKEIQEAEAQRAAKREEEAAALRRAALERELANQVAPPPAPGLPSSSTWASGDTVTSPSASGPSAWAKATTKTVATPGGSKKTLQQIQKEEEALAKKQKAAALAAQGAAVSGSPTAAQSASGGKRYADLASRVAAPTPPGGSAWTTVGASGKTKTPAAAPPSTLQRTATGGLVNNVAASAAAKKPTAAPIRSTSSATTLSAHDEFKRWAVGELRPDLNKGVDAQDLVTMLLEFPIDKDLITETVHSASNTIDSRHFAEEYVKRRALADKGKAQPPSNAAASVASSQPASNGKSNGGGGWSEVARKGPAPAPKEDAAFKIVATKKKGAKR